MREVGQLRRAMEDEGCVLALKWISPHCNIPGNESAGALATSAYREPRTVRLELIQIARIIIYEGVQRH